MTHNQKEQVLRAVEKLIEDADMLRYCLTEMKYFPSRKPKDEEEASRHDADSGGYFMSSKSNLKDLQLYRDSIEYSSKELIQIADNISNASRLETSEK